MSQLNPPTNTLPCGTGAFRPVPVLTPATCTKREEGADADEAAPPNEAEARFFVFFEETSDQSVSLMRAVCLCAQLQQEVGVGALNAGGDAASMCVLGAGCWATAAAHDAFFVGACAQAMTNDVNAAVGEMGGRAEGHEACSGIGMGLQRLHPRACLNV